MSVPTWLTGGNVAMPTTRSFTASPVGVAPAPDAVKICTGTTVADLGADAVGGVLTDDDLVVSTRPAAAKDRRGEFTLHVGSSKPGDGAALDQERTRGEPGGCDHVVTRAEGVVERGRGLVAVGVHREQVGVEAVRAPACRSTRPRNRRRPHTGRAPRPRPSSRRPHRHALATAVGTEREREAGGGRRAPGAAR